MIDVERINALRAEIKAKQAEINRLRREGETVVGSARLARRSSYYGKPEEWAVAYRIPLRHCGGRNQSEQYRSICAYPTRAEAVAAIPGIINDLAELYKAASAEESNETGT